MDKVHKHHFSNLSPEGRIDLIATAFPGDDGVQDAYNIMVHHPDCPEHGKCDQYPISAEAQKFMKPLLNNVFQGPDGLIALADAVKHHPNYAGKSAALNLTGPSEPQLEQEAHEAILELVKLCDADPKATVAIIKQYGEKPAATLEEQVQQVVALSQKFGEDFEKKFLADVAKYKGFDIGKIFQAIKKAFQTVGKIFKPIVDAIKKAIAKHKAAKAAQGAAANKPAAPKPKGNSAVGIILAFLGLAAIGILIWWLNKDGKKAAA